MRRHPLLGLAVGLVALAPATAAAHAAGSLAWAAPAAQLRELPAGGGPLAPVIDAQPSGGTVSLFGGPPGAVTVQIPVQLSGRLVLSYHGDAAAGCAARGLCGYTGQLQWEPSTSGQLELLRARTGSTVYGAALLLGGLTSTNVQLAAAQPNAQPGVCLDSQTASALNLPVYGSSVVFSLAAGQPSIFDTRCAGPLTQDVLAALTAQTLAGARVLAGELSVSLAGSAVFSAGGFAGSVDSTVQLRLGRPRTLRNSSGPLPPNLHLKRYHVLKVGYRAAVSGTLVESIAGDATAAACTLLDSCGLAGTLTVTPPATTATVKVIVAARDPNRPYSDLLAAIGLDRRGNPRGVTVLGGGALPSGGTELADLTQGAGFCRDAAPLGLSAVLLAGRSRLAVGYELGNARTRCPGPLPASPIGALGLLSPRGLAAPVARVPLTLPGGLFGVGAPGGSGTVLDDGYTGTLAPHLMVTLTRLSVRRATIVAPLTP